MKKMYEITDVNGIKTYELLDENGKVERIRSGNRKIARIIPVESYEHDSIIQTQVTAYGYCKQVTGVHCSRLRERIERRA